MIINTDYYDNVLSVTTDDGITKHYRNIFYEMDQNSPEFTELLEILRNEHDNEKRGTPLNPPPSRNDYEGPLYAKHPDLYDDAALVEFETSLEGGRTLLDD